MVVGGTEVRVRLHEEPGTAVVDQVVVNGDDLVVVPECGHERRTEAGDRMPEYRTSSPPHLPLRAVEDLAGLVRATFSGGQAGVPRDPWLKIAKVGPVAP